ncbi:hypothetical protein [Helicobacter canis]|nr:hypothetical protein [Helicobacter canis]
MIANGIGGANTRTGLVFEGKVDLATFLSQQNMSLIAMEKCFIAMNW